ncbi:hypothetical protein [uncultured Jannaschia sp.]|uniref:hypothetical protein n=1 Tax=uncultured Jannaschia sp. TaxID=293347 RepID=UPI002603261D|nr:hypothetical protein [uncultured Jannaschia sp.]
MRPSVSAILLLPLLAACATPVADEVARSAARRAVNPVIAERFPGIPLEPATNCIIDSATASEIITLATSARSAPDRAARIVLDVAQRPATIQCLATDGLPVLLNTL